MSYSLAFTVAAASEADAIGQAKASLPSHLYVRGIGKVEQLSDGKWRVVLSIWED